MTVPVPRNQILVGDCMAIMPTLPRKFVQCVVTSPPYFALRSYLPPGHPDKSKEIGSEPTPEAFIATMVAVFREVRELMRDDGVLFLNLGDCYADDSKWGGRSRRGADNDPKRGSAANGQPKKRTDSGMLQNLPHRVAEALRADGWNWRQTIIWAKKSPMCESVKGPRWERCQIKIKPQQKGKQDGATFPGRSRDMSNGVYLGSAEYEPCPGCKKCIPNDGWIYRNGKGRCTSGHEYVFVFSKGDQYFWDTAASAEPAVGATPGNRANRDATAYVNSADHHRTVGLTNIGARETRNPRSVWTLSSEPTKQKHFATFPSELVRRCLVAGVSGGGCCAHCGKPWAPMIERDRVATRPGLDTKAGEMWKHADGDAVGQRSKSAPNLDPQRHIALTNCVGYRPSCSCPPHEPAKQIVFDPFSGLCTVQQTARELGHDWLGTELNQNYVDIGNVRIHDPPRWLLRQQKAAKKRKPKADIVSPQLLLFGEDAA